MENWRKDNRREPVITDVDALVPKDHLLRDWAAYLNGCNCVR